MNSNFRNFSIRRSLTNLVFHQIIFATLLALAAAHPQYAPSYESNSVEHAIIRDARVNPSADGAFSYDVETSNGIRVSKSGAGSGPDGAVESQGTVSFTHPNGEAFELRFVADANGYQPESSALPVAPVALHPIPQYALDQIEKAAREDAAGIRYEKSSSEEQSRYYN